MPQPPKLRKKRVGKSTYWFTSAGGEPTYFGNVNELSYDQARDAFSKLMESLSAGKRPNNGMSCYDLMELFLEWVVHHRSQRTYDQRRRDCNRFANFRVRGGKHLVADLPAVGIRGGDLEEWLENCRAIGESPQTMLHRQTSIKHCWNWGASHPSPNSHVPPTFRPFAAVERIHVPCNVLTEDRLITDEEVQSLFTAARADLDQFHRFGPKQPRAVNPYAAFEEMLRAYYHTGARTAELTRVEVADVLPRTRQVVLGVHKTSRTQKTQRDRHITLNDEAMAIFERNCHRKDSHDRVFATSDGRPWKQWSIAKRFARIKEVVPLLELPPVRDHITIYDFRHLWISEALMAGNDIATVAHMAGTSVAMIERVYGHFRNEHLHEAQSRLDVLRQRRATTDV